MLNLFTIVVNIPESDLILWLIFEKVTSLTANSKGSDKRKAVFRIFRHVLSIMCVSSLQ